MAEATASRFERAAERVASHLAASLPSDKLLQLYGLYKQSVVGPCDVPKPGWFQMQAKQKWESWRALGDMPPSEAMERYVALVSELDPDWDDSAHKHVGWVSVSCMQKPDDVLEADKTVFDWVKECDVDKLAVCLEGLDANSRDTEGMGLIHWAADRGHATVVELLVNSSGAQVDLTDGDGQTALHYAASCDHTDVAKLLLLAGADVAIADNDGLLPLDVAASQEIADLLRSHTR